MKTEEIKQRLKYLEEQIIKENISYAEIMELQELKEHIPSEDVLLSEWAGITEQENISN